MKKSRYIWFALAVAVLSAVIFSVMASGSKKTQTSLYSSVSELLALSSPAGDTISRAEALHMILTITGEAEKALNEPVESHFTDASGDTKKEADYAFSCGIVSGDGDGLFFPDNEVTLEEMLTIVLRVLGEKPTDAKNAFSLADTHKIYPNSASNSLCFFLSVDQCGEILWNLLHSVKPGTEVTFASALVDAKIIDKEALESVESEIEYDFDAPHDVLTNHVYETETTHKEPETTKPEETTEGGWSPIWKP